MFSLIIVIISVALVALLALATVFFGGDVFLRGNADAEASRYINESQQISAAIRLYQADNAGNLPSEIRADLVGHYLRGMPEAGEEWNIGDDIIIKAVANANTCEMVNQRGGWVNPDFVEGGPVSRHEPVSCGDPSLASQTYYCCVNEEASGD